MHECTVDDLPGLDAEMPLGGAHRQRLELQSRGDCSYLVASSDVPVGVCVVRWTGPYHADVAARWPACVEINHLHVVARARNLGVGRALIGAAERLCARRRVDMVGLGVADENADAARLYAGLGYVDSGVQYEATYDYVDSDGAVRHAREHNRYLVKQLPAAAG